MEKDYVFNCAGCKKADTEYWYGDDGIEIVADVKLYGRPTVQYHGWGRSDAYGIYTGLYCNKCYQRDTLANPVDERYSYGIYAGNFCSECCYGFMDHCGIDQPQGSVQDLDDFIEI